MRDLVTFHGAFLIMRPSSRGSITSLKTPCGNPAVAAAAAVACFPAFLLPSFLPSSLSLSLSLPLFLSLLNLKSRTNQLTCFIAAVALHAVASRSRAPTISSQSVARVLAPLWIWFSIWQIFRQLHNFLMYLSLMSQIIIILFSLKHWFTYFTMIKIWRGNLTKHPWPIIGASFVLYNAKKLTNLLLSSGSGIRHPSTFAWAGFEPGTYDFIVLRLKLYATAPSPEISYMQCHRLGNNLCFDSDILPNFFAALWGARNQPLRQFRCSTE